MIERNICANELANIGDGFNQTLDMLHRQEGGYLHRNRTELDITTGYGIYKYANPRASIWEYIDEVARSCGEMRHSREWDAKTIALINKQIDPVIERYYSYLFYKDYFAVLNLNAIPCVLIPLVTSIYCNAPKILIKGLQFGANKFNITRHGPNAKKLAIDGVLGPTTRGVLENIYMSSTPEELLALKSYIIDGIKQGYRNLANANPPKYGRYLNGWLRRVNEFA